MREILVNPKIKLGSRYVGKEEPVYIIAEGGLTNWGNLELAKKQADVSMAAGADCVKFQAQTTEELASAKVDPFWYKRLKYKELSHKELTELWRYVSVRNIDCGITAHTDVDLDFLDKKLNVPFFKVGSGESVNYDFLKNVGRRKKPVVMSLGLHLTDDEILKSVKVLKDSGALGVAILHCSTVYPTPPKISDLGAIERLQKLLPDCVIGYSDHSVGWHLPLAAVALGAKIIEKHISFDKKDKRSLDCPGSCEPDDLKEMVAQIRDVEAALKQPGNEREEAVKNARKWARQSIVARLNIPKGKMLTKEMIAFKRPGAGLSPDEAHKIVGKKATRAIEADTLVTLKDVK
ncbi:MAG: N-acetylneuraminate synthase family protein [bacterium]|nr:N-acetylneuraminate synthase family protein [bacterium]